MKASFFALLGLAGALVASPLSAASEVYGTTPGVSKVSRIKGMDSAPVPVERVTPVYPREMREKGIQGFATVDVLVDSSGLPREITLVSATSREFGERALTAARGWRFEPAKAQGQPISARVQLPFQFVMPQVAAMEARR